MDSYDILVIILSITLAIFLFVGIVVMFLLIKILQKVKSASETAQHVAENMEHFTTNLRQATKATATGSVLAQLVRVFKRKEK